MDPNIVGTGLEPRNQNSVRTQDSRPPTWIWSFEHGTELQIWTHEDQQNLHSELGLEQQEWALDTRLRPRAGTWMGNLDPRPGALGLETQDCDLGPRPLN
uniref:Uncharacterized protein n=1 Tax=Cannabis sativa TaxID=3483 RepID=A0A803PKR8_CANSA